MCIATDEMDCFCLVQQIIRKKEDERSSVGGETQLLRVSTILQALSASKSFPASVSFNNYLIIVDRKEY